MVILNKNHCIYIKIERKKLNAIKIQQITKEDKRRKEEDYSKQKSDSMTAPFPDLLVIYLIYLISNIFAIVLNINMFKNPIKYRTAKGTFRLRKE